MSVVVAIKENGRVYLGADSQVTRGGSRSTLKNPNNYKLWNVKNAPNCIMGSVGAIKDANIVRLMDHLVTEYNVYKGHIDYEFVVKKVVQDIVKELKEFGYIKDDFTEFLNSSFVFAFRDQLYLIGMDLSVLEIDDYCAIGSGSSEAIGSLVSTQGENPIKRIVKAIKSSAASDIYVDYPIILTDTANTEFVIVTEDDEDAILSFDPKANAGKKKSSIKKKSSKKKEKEEDQKEAQEEKGE